MDIGTKHIRNNGYRHKIYREQLLWEGTQIERERGEGTAIFIYIEGNTTYRPLWQVCTAQETIGTSPSLPQPTLLESWEIHRASVKPNWSANPLNRFSLVHMRTNEIQIPHSPSGGPPATMVTWLVTKSNIAQGDSNGNSFLAPCSSS